MLSARSLLLADELALEVLLVPAPALDLTALQSAHAHLVHHDFALRAGTFVAASGADVPAVQLPAARHTASRDILSTAFSVLCVSCDHLDLVFPTGAGLLQLGGLPARGALAEMALLLAEVVAAVEFLPADLLARVGREGAIDDVV